MKNSKLIRITTVPISLDKLLQGQLKYMSSFYEVVAISSDPVYLEKIGNREGVRTFPLRLTRKITPFADFLAVVTLLLWLRKEKPLIVHSHTPKAGLVAMLASKLAGVPIRLHTVAGLPLLETTGLKRKLLNFIEWLTYSCATKVYPNSFGLKDIILRNKFCDPTKIGVIANGSSNGIDIDYFNRNAISDEVISSYKEKHTISSSDFVFIFVGRLVSDKGINEMVTAFERVQKKNAAAKLLLVGHFEPDLDPILPETLLKIKENKAIISVGYQNDVRPFYAISNALLFPSYREGFPNVVMQAGAMNLPSIVSDINGCNEIIEADVNGVIIPIKDSKAIENAMNNFIENPNYFGKLQGKAREMITSRYGQLHVWKAIHEEYLHFSNK